MTAANDLPPGDLATGETIGRFEILGRLGQGGMGVVYRARDRKLDRTVALKFLPPHLAGSQDEIRRFVREAQVASALDHPNICTVHAIEETADGRTFIAMAAYEGETVQERLEGGPLAVGEAVDIALQAARGLDAAHERNTIHRDIKPGNLMVTRDGLVKILDFGLSRVTAVRRSGGGEARAGDGTGEVPVGTAAYVSPEQARGEATGPQADVWSLGAVLYEMLAGRAPFGGSHDPTALDRILHEDPAPLPSFTRVPGDVERIVRKALTKDPAARYATMGELISDLERLPARSLSRTPPDPRGPAAASPRRRAVLALAVVAVLGLGWFVLRAPDAPERGAPRQAEARRLLADAQRSLRLLDGRGARESLEQALTLEPGNPQLHSALAEALSLLGREAEARIHGQQAFDTALVLPAPERDLYQARLAVLRGNPERAVDLLESYWSFREGRGDWNPEERLERGLELAEARIRAGRDGSALELIRSLSGGQAEEDPRLALIATAASSDWRERLEAARAAADLARRQDAPWIEARARFYEGRALRSLGDADGAEAALEASIALSAENGHTKGEADAVTTLGNLYWDRNDLARAKALYERAVVLYGQSTTTRLAVRALTNKALVVLEQGDLDAAVEIFREALSEQRQSDDRLGQVYTLVNLAGPLMIAGRLDEAAETYSQASRLASEVQDPNAQTLVLESTGELQTLRGDLTGARRSLEGARELARASGDRHAFARAGQRLARVLRFDGDLDGARRLYAESLAAFEELGDATSAGQLHRDLGETLLWAGDLPASREHFEEALAVQEDATDLSWTGTRLSLAELLLEEGRAPETETLARQSTENLERHRFHFETVRGYEILARALEARGELAEARAAIDRASELLGSADCPMFRLPVNLTAAQLHLDAREADAARSLLQSTLAEATNHGFLLWELQARVMLGELELLGGDLRAGRARLKRVAEEAETHGFGLMARKARRLAA